MAGLDQTSPAPSDGMTAAASSIRLPAAVDTSSLQSASTARAASKPATESSPPDTEQPLQSKQDLLEYSSAWWLLIPIGTAVVALLWLFYRPHQRDRQKQIVQQSSLADFFVDDPSSANTKPQLERPTPVELLPATQTYEKTDALMGTARPHTEDVEPMLALSPAMTSLPESAPASNALSASISLLVFAPAPIAPMWRYRPLGREHWYAWKRVDPVNMLPFLPSKSAANEEQSVADLRATEDMARIPDDTLLHTEASPNSTTAATTQPAPSAELSPVTQATPASLPFFVQDMSPPDVWQKVQQVLFGIEHAAPATAEARYREATQLLLEAVHVTPPDQQPRLQASLINLDLLQAKQQKGASRLLALRNMQVRHADALHQAAAPVLDAWIDTLLYWARCQVGTAALSKCSEAQIFCLQLQNNPEYARSAQRRQAEALVLRANIEEGGLRLDSLRHAISLLEGLYEQEAKAENALVLAKAILAYGQLLPSDQARTAYSHAFAYALTAEREPQFAIESLQCRLAIQWAFEQLPGAQAHGQAFELVQRLETLQIHDADTLRVMAQIYLRSGDYAHACRLCEQAWQSEQTNQALLATWQEICRQWAASSSHRHDAGLQASERQLKRASFML